MPIHKPCGIKTGDGCGERFLPKTSTGKFCDRCIKTRKMNGRVKVRKMPQTTLKQLLERPSPRGNV